MKKRILKLAALSFTFGIFAFNLMAVKPEANSLNDADFNAIIKASSAQAESSGMRGRPLMYGSGGYCCKNSGSDCGAAAC